MLTILKLFGRSPFTPLRTHIEKVAACVYLLEGLFESIEKGEFAQAESIANQISKLEHDADLTKNDIRNNLPKTVYLPMDRGNLLEILSLQDSIADVAEDIAVVATLKPLTMFPDIYDDFRAFLHKNFEAFEGVKMVMEELHELLESSFGGVEAQKVRTMIDNVAKKEHEVDILQRQLLKDIISKEEELTFVSFSLWLKVFELIASLSNISEKLANRVRMSLDLK